jgi:hypothetical protein
MKLKHFFMSIVLLGAFPMAMLAQAKITHLNVVDNKETKLTLQLGKGQSRIVIYQPWGNEWNRTAVPTRQGLGGFNIKFTGEGGKVRNRYLHRSQFRWIATNYYGSGKVTISIKHNKSVLKKSRIKVLVQKVIRPKVDSNKTATIFKNPAGSNQLAHIGMRAKYNCGESYDKSELSLFTNNGDNDVWQFWYNTKWISRTLQPGEFINLSCDGRNRWDQRDDCCEVIMNVRYSPKR